jgi:hypothetical protein
MCRGWAIPLDIISNRLYVRRSFSRYAKPWHVSFASVASRIGPEHFFKILGQAVVVEL